MNKTLIKGWLWTFLATFSVTVLSLAPIPENPPLGDVPLIDKWVHFVMYGGVVSAVWLDLYLRVKRKAQDLYLHSRKQAQDLCLRPGSQMQGNASTIHPTLASIQKGRWSFALITFLCAALLGGVMELLQGLSGYRSCDMLDFVANSLGAMLGTVVCLVLSKIVRI